MENREPKSLNLKILSGATWTVLQMVVSRLISFLVSLILARVLLPEHFGIVGMAVVFTGLFSAIGDLGLGAALIQFKEDLLKQIHLDTAFWLSLLFNTVVFILLAAVIAPLGVRFYDEQILRLVIPVMGMSILFSPFSLIHRILLTRELRFKALSIIAVYSALGAGTAAVALALSGAGVWSIVIQTVLASLLPIPVLWRTTRWTPRFRFSRQAFHEIFGFSLYDALQRTLSYLSRNVDTLLVGKMLGSELLGFYSFAYTLTDVFRQHLMSVLNKVMFPVYGQLQEDIRAVKRNYLRVVKYNTLLITPIMLLLIYFAGEVIPLFFGEKWLPAVVPVQAMAAASIIHAVGGTSDSVLKGLGRFKLNFRITAFRIFLVIFPVFFVCVYFWGILGAAAAVVVRKLFTRFIYQYHLRKVINVSEMELLRSVKSAFIGAFVTIPVYLLFELAGTASVWVLAAAGAAIGSTYLAAVWLLEKEELKWAAGRIAQLVQRNRESSDGDRTG